MLSGKVITIVRISLLTLPLFTNCDEKLDIKPEDTLVENDVFAEEALAERALGGAYYELVVATTGLAYTLGDFTTNITQTEDIEFYGKFINGNLRPDDETIASIWLNYYTTINLANGLIVNIPKFGAYNAEVQAQHIGEAKFIRAFSYLNLLILFGEGALTHNMNGMGVPLQLAPFDGYNENDNILPRSSVEDVYNQIINDLTEAVAAVPETYGNSTTANLNTRSRASQGGAYALLSRVYLYKGDYSKAAEMAREVIIKNSLYELVNDLITLFPDNLIRTSRSMPKEYLFGYPHSMDKMGSNNISFAYHFKLSLWANKDFLSEYPPQDLRLDTLIYDGDTEYNQHIVSDRSTTFKFTEPYGRDNVPMIRLAEILLTRAEALARIDGINQESVNLLNTVYLRSNPKAPAFKISDFADSQQFINRILKERKLELAFEGLHRYDAIRTEAKLKNPNLASHQLTFPIPQTDIEISKGVIRQNPGY